MRKSIRTLVLATLGALAPPLVGAAELPFATTQTEAERVREEQQRARQEATPDTPGTGRFPAVKEEIRTPVPQVLYRPADPAALGDTKLGIYVFGNGACIGDGASSRLHLLEVASHGYLAIAPGRILNGPGATGPRPPPATSQAPELNIGSSHRDLLQAIDWAIAQNADPKSPWFGRIDTRAIAASGYSCGGAQAMRVAADPRVKTLVMMNRGLFPDGSSVAIPEMDVRKSALQALHGPALYVIGGETDTAWGNAKDDFSRIDHVPVVVANIEGVGHGGTFWEPNGGRAAAIVVAWLDWQLRGDARAARQFTGRDCGLCRDQAVKVEKKRVD
jgi:hypothetical protein